MKEIDITFRDIDDQRILQSDGMTAFWLIICVLGFSWIWGFHRKTENCNVFPFT